jgi:hypothetical protein
VEHRSGRAGNQQEDVSLWRTGVGEQEISKKKRYRCGAQGRAHDHPACLWPKIKSRCVALLRTDVSEELIAFTIRVKRIAELVTTLASTSN